VIAGAMLLSEHVTWNEPIGGILVIAGAAIAQGIISLPALTKSSN
jgi:hypothetical protein